MKKGFGLLELVMVIGIFGIILVILVTSFSAFRHQQALDKDVQVVASYLEEARAKTLASNSASQYGVHITSSSVTLFQGAAYSAGNSSNKVFNLTNTVTASTISLNGGGSAVVFQRLTGETDQYGTLVYRSSTATGTKSVTIYKTGLIDVQ